MYDEVIKSALSQSIFFGIAIILAKRYESHLLNVIARNEKSLDKRDDIFEKLADQLGIVVDIKENTDKIPYIEEDVKELKYNNKIGVVRNAQQT